MATNPTGTYFYAPDIKAFVFSTSLNKVVDLSPDIMSFSVNRQTNATSTASLQLTNKGFKYTPAHWVRSDAITPLETMDRIVIYLKRNNYVQAFSGYITMAPVLTLIPEPVNIQAHCTIYKVQNTFWDIGNPSYQALIPGMLMTGMNETSNYSDGGTSQGIVNVLTSVVGWHANKIHISAIPSNFVANSVRVYNNDIKTTIPQNGTDTLMRALDGAGIISGKNLISTGAAGTGPGNYVTYSGLSPQLTQAVAIPNGALTYATLPPLGYHTGTSNNGQAGIVVKNTPIKDVLKAYHVDGKRNPTSDEQQDPDYWCVVPWPYFTDNIDVADAVNWLKNDGYGGNTGRHLLLTSITNAKQVIVKASIGGYTDGNIVISRKAWEYLAGSPVSYNLQGGATGDFYGNSVVSVTAAWAEPGKTVKGPVDNSSLVSNLSSYGYQLSPTLAEQVTGLEVVPRTSAGTGGGTFNGLRTNPGAPVGANPTATTLNTIKKWAKECLRLAGFPETSWNINFIITWVDHEQGRDWARRNNPLNDGNATVATRFSANANKWGLYGAKGGFPTLEDAAKSWARAMQTVAEGGYNPNLYAELGAIFDSNPRYYTVQENGVTVRKQYPSCNTPKGAERKTSQKWSLFATALSKSPWDVGGYGGIASAKDIFRPKNIKDYPISNAGVDNLTTAAGGGGGGGGGGGSTVVITNAGNSFNTEFVPPQIDTETLVLQGTPRAFVTDQPVLSSISNMVTAGLRCFQSAPTGDFVAWFPDYFGLYGQAPSLCIYDIEIIDFQIYHDDTLLTTHVGISGDPINLGSSVGMIDWMMTNGIVSVQIDQIMAQLFNLTLDELNSLVAGTDQTSFSQAFLLRYGMRPKTQEVPTIRSHVTEFMYAWQLFMTSWANQYSTQIQLTFMPEVYPGMRIRLEEHGIEVYVQAVSHQGDRAGGFTTTVQVTCPVYRAKDTDKPVLLHYGFPFVKKQNI